MGPGSKTRIDAYLAKALPTSSRARLSSVIKDGHVTVNGAACLKASSGVRPGDRIVCMVPPPPASRALPEAIPLKIVYEDGDVLVIDKPAGMVVHPCPSAPEGTLVNALLHHCGLGPVEVDADGLAPSALSWTVEGEDDEPDSGPWRAPGRSGPGVIRPGIVHRLDKGTTGLLVAAKTEPARLGLVRQFASRSVERVYWSLTLGAPPASEGRLSRPVGRDPRNRTRMATFDPGSSHGRHAESRWRVAERLCGGLSSLTAWKLGTGRTHQIRVHAQHLGCPLLGDETYGAGPRSMAAAAERHGCPRSFVDAHLAALGRPMLHAATLGFEHPVTGQQLRFESPPTGDFVNLLRALRSER